MAEGIIARIIREGERGKRGDRQTDRHRKNGGERVNFRRLQSFKSVAATGHQPYSSDVMAKLQCGLLTYARELLFIAHFSAARWHAVANQGLENAWVQGTDSAERGGVCRWGRGLGR